MGSLAPLDHSGLAYEEFEKDFYIEAPALAALTLAEVGAEHCGVAGIDRRWRGVMAGSGFTFFAGLSLACPLMSAHLSLHALCGAPPSAGECAAEVPGTRRLGV